MKKAFMTPTPFLVGGVVTLVAVIGILYLRSVFLCARDADLNALLFVSFVQEQIPEIRNPMWFPHQPENRIGDLSNDKYIPMVTVGDSCNRFLLQKCIELQIDDKIQRAPDVLERLNQLISDSCKYLVDSSETNNVNYKQRNKVTLTNYFECNKIHRQERFVIVSLVKGLDQPPIPISVSGDAKMYQSPLRELITQSKKFVK